MNTTTLLNPKPGKEPDNVPSLINDMQWIKQKLDAFLQNLQPATMKEAE